MRQNYRSILFLVLFLFGTLVIADPVLIKVDEAHSQIGGAGENATKYKFQPFTTITIDYDGYVFDIWGQPETPDTLSVVIDNTRQYYLKLDPKSKKHTFSGNDFIPKSGAPVFSGLSLGDTAMLALGNLKIDSIKKEEKLRVQWVGMLEVIK
jgi:hypothetical protein